jgi:hypothetical protein
MPTCPSSPGVDTPRVLVFVKISIESRKTDKKSKTDQIFDRFDVLVEIHQSEY